MKRKINLAKFFSGVWHYGKWFLVGVFIGFAFGCIFL